MNPSSSPRDASPMPTRARWLVEHFRMVRIPQEGAWFAPTFRSDETAVLTDAI